MTTLEGTELCLPQLLNTSCRKPLRSHSEVMLISFFLSLISVLTAILNLLVIISIAHFKQLHTPTNILLLSLAVSDFLVGFLMYFQVFLIQGCWFLGDLMCAVYHYFAYVITSSSFGTMMLISIDRYVAICDPLRYTTKITQRRAAICSFLCWLFAVLHNSLLLMDHLTMPGKYNSCFGECVIGMNYIAGIADLMLNFMGPITVIIILYMRIFVVAVSQARAMRTHIAAVTVSPTARKSEIKAATTIGVVIAVFVMCICPYFCFALTNQNALINASTEFFVIWLTYFNSCLNPVIYAFFYPWFRVSTKLIVTLQILQPKSCQAKIL
ncbi:trace amine-associated receptor 13c-like [Genypterus blacodes]|uniref:trace amine-associated receptor 13c-like n=1 Tax=Genypterus blacodes TaxID=154954 RepID=UPI003F75B28E